MGGGNNRGGGGGGGRDARVVWIGRTRHWRVRHVHCVLAEARNYVSHFYFFLAQEIIRLNLSVFIYPFVCFYLFDAGTCGCLTQKDLKFLEKWVKGGLCFVACIVWKICEVWETWSLWLHIHVSWVSERGKLKRKRRRSRLGIWHDTTQSLTILCYNNNVCLMRGGEKRLEDWGRNLGGVLF